ncbi:MAG: DEAD/DEAH box helicase [Gemmatimonadaceae bacterium]|nr:DEAD/DEAH box helicase [Gemmatimonadaceae bacterium]
MPHQVEAVRTVRDLEYAALFHEQGLGKTKIGLDLTLHWLAGGVVDSVLVVTKKTLVENWVREITSHTYLRPVVLNQNSRANFWALNAPVRLYVTHYEVMHSERTRFEMLAESRRLGVLLDEAQRIKNPGTAPARALHALAPKFTRRVIMTGTPVANRPYDLWSQVFFLDQGEALGTSFASFKCRADLDRSVAEDPAAARAFETKVAGVPSLVRAFSVRETKESAELNLPGKTLRDTPAELEEEQWHLYQRYKTELRAEIEIEGVLTMDDAERVLKRLLRLVQVASNPQLVDESYGGEPGKLPVLDRILNGSGIGEAKKIVWTAFTDNVEMIARRYSGLEPARLHGKRPIADRNADITRFLEDDNCRLLVATPGAAKEGLTLTVSDHAIFFDRSFSLDDYLQAQDRIHRISQTRDCVVENLIATRTIDEWVGTLLSAKELAAALTQGDVNLEEYRDKATYDFVRALDSVLG